LIKFKKSENRAQKEEKEKIKSNQKKVLIKDLKI
jgi:hypothetical protein